MNTLKLYWYSGTGNSLLIAEKIGLKYKEKGYDVKLIHIAQPLDQIERPSSDDIVGLCTPVHAFRLPKLVMSFIRQEPLIGQYRFLITTSGGGTFNAHQHAKKNGFDCHYVDNIIMPDNCLILFYTPNSSSGDEVTTPIIQKGITEVDRVASNLLEKKSNQPESSIGGQLMTGLVGSLYNNNLKKLPTHFNVLPSCNQCSTCVKLCPEQNIALTDHSVAFGTNCSGCLACMQWCPKASIQYKNKTNDKGRYHNPLISFNEMTSPIITLK